MIPDHVAIAGKLDLAIAALTETRALLEQTRNWVAAPQQSTFVQCEHRDASGRRCCLVATHPVGPWYPGDEGHLYEDGQRVVGDPS